MRAKMNDKKVIASILGTMFSLIIVGYFTGFITKADYKPETFVTKDRYNKDQLTYTEEKATIKAELGHLKTGQTEIKTSLKELIKKVK